MPKIAIVVPTYNRAQLLLRVLEALRVQSLPDSEFEVIVADDGSSDDTASLVRSFASDWRLKYHFQEDLGYRAAAVRNAGARLAETDILVFLDAGTIPAPGFAANHLAAHMNNSHSRRAIIGPVYGYSNIQDDSTYLNDIAQLSADRIQAIIPKETDPRYDTFERVNFDLSRLALPPALFWSGNCSVRTEEFWNAGGFDEDFQGWGMEDVDLGYRLWHRGAEFGLCEDAWAIELPHPRNYETNVRTWERNILRFLQKNNFAPPSAEMFAILLSKDILFELEHFYRALTQWEAEAKLIDVRRELDTFRRCLGNNTRIGVFGVGGSVPGSISQALLYDFDSQFTRPAGKSGPPIYQGIGLRTQLADKCIDAVLITSRMLGIWDQLGEMIFAEASRVAKDVHLGWSYQQET